MFELFQNFVVIEKKLWGTEGYHRPPSCMIVKESFIRAKLLKALLQMEMKIS